MSSESTRLIHSCDDEWPSYLDEIPDPPKELFVRGESIHSGEQAVAIVGSRRPTAAGVEAARHFAVGLAQAGFAIVSGMAMGIDSVVHRAVLEIGGYTMAVLGTGLDIAYPERNMSLQKKIAAQGTIVAEYRDGTESRPWHFPERNRIIAGLCMGVLVVEGGQKSGARITASRALDYSRRIFAIPGSTRNPQAWTPNELIRTGNAALVTHFKHITDDVAPSLVWPDANPPGTPQVNLSDDEETVLMFLDDAPVSPDLLCSETDMSEGKAALTLSRLEVRNLVKLSDLGYELTEGGTRARASVCSGQ